jgi:hypothetical protein
MNIYDVNVTCSVNTIRDKRFQVLHAVFDLCKMLGEAAKRNNMSVEEFLKINIDDYREHRMFED